MTSAHASAAQLTPDMAEQLELSGECSKRMSGQRRRDQARPLRQAGRHHNSAGATHLFPQDGFLLHQGNEQQLISPSSASASSSAVSMRRLSALSTIAACEDTASVRQERMCARGRLQGKETLAHESCCCIPTCMRQATTLTFHRRTSISFKSASRSAA